MAPAHSSTSTTLSFDQVSTSAPPATSELAVFNEIVQANQWGCDDAAIIVSSTREGFSAHGYLKPVGLSAASTSYHAKSATARIEVAGALTQQFRQWLSQRQPPMEAVRNSLPRLRKIAGTRKRCTGSTGTVSTEACAGQTGPCIGRSPPVPGRIVRVSVRTVSKK